MNDKPLGSKAYGSIGHLPNSRIGTGDHHVHQGQADICTKKSRRGDSVIVQEKLDGSNVAVFRRGDELLPLIRAGYLAASSPRRQHQLFAQWATDNAARILEVIEDGERLCGEWLAMAHGTRYALPHEPFVAFDIMRGQRRLLYEDFCLKCARGCVTIPHLIGIGNPMSVEDVLAELDEECNGHGALDPVEGAVWRVERESRVDFLAKYVRPSKADGAYFTADGLPDVWNTWPESSWGVKP